MSTVAIIVLPYLVAPRLFSEASRQEGAPQQVFRTLAYLTLVLWSLYPVV